MSLIPGTRKHRCPPCHRQCAGDRKSTRLNSSHSQISYAVFCLKKKKKPPQFSLSPSKSIRSYLPTENTHRMASINKNPLTYEIWPLSLTFTRSQRRTHCATRKL